MGCHVSTAGYRGKKVPIWGGPARVSIEAPLGKVSTSIFSDFVMIRLIETDFE